MQDWRDRVPILAMLAAFVVLAVAYSLASPLYESTDEIGHYRYIEFLRLYRRLPAPRENGVLLQAHHPPLFHAAAALVSAWVPRDRAWDAEPERNPHWAYRYWETGADNKNQFMHREDEAWPYHGTTLAVHVIRWFNIALGALTVGLAYQLAQTILPGRRALALAATALVAFNPMVLHLSGGVDNDIAAGLMGTATLLVCVKLVGQASRLTTYKGRPPTADQSSATNSHGFLRKKFVPMRGELRLPDSWQRLLRVAQQLPNNTIALGLLLGLALLTKTNLLALLPVIEIALAVAAWQHRSWQMFIRANVVVLGLAALIAGWWYARNMLLYGEPTGVGVVLREWGGERDPREGLYVALGEMPYLWTSLWGRFGYGQIPLADGVYTALLVVVMASLPGWLWLWLRGKADRSEAIQLGLCALCVLLQWVTVFTYAVMNEAAAMGRFLFPALAAAGVLVVVGWSGWLPARWEKGLALIACGGMLALAVYSLFGVLAPAYARPAQLSKEQIAAIPHPTQVVLGNQARLLGYDVSTDRLSPGGELIVTAYWQALAPSARDLTVFVHLISRAGPMVAQRDTYPGLGSFPASSWQPGDTWRDRYRIVLDAQTYTPDVADVTLGLYVPGGGRLPITLGGSGDALALARVTIAPPLNTPPGALPNPVNVNFDDKITLLGYELNDRTVRAGEALTITLYWQIPVTTTHDYSVFAHLMDGPDTMWAMEDGLPFTKPKRTRWWVANQVYTDTRPLRPAPETPPGSYPIELGIYGGESGDRFTIWREGRAVGDRLTLTQIQITAP